jgi:TolA-binding protein
MKTHPIPRLGILVVFTLATTGPANLLHAQEEDPAVLRARIAALEKRLAELEDKQSSEEQLASLRAENQTMARKRAAEDRQRYSPEELREIESLYQVANRQWRSDEARESLTKLLETYDHANRTGCATLYMGQMSEGKERLDYLTRAVEKFSDCYYFDGCQVGGYGRYVLALTLWESGDKDKARALLQELKTHYKHAIDHKGRPIAELAAAAEKELENK